LPPIGQRVETLDTTETTMEAMGGGNDWSDVT
jgi:hypothetical protein